jgi:hypothetical protein
MFAYEVLRYEDEEIGGEKGWGGRSLLGEDWSSLLTAGRGR